MQQWLLQNYHHPSLMQKSYTTKQNKSQKQHSEPETKHKKQQENKNHSGTSASTTPRTHEAGLGAETRLLPVFCIVQCHLLSRVVFLCRILPDSPALLVNRDLPCTASILFLCATTFCLSCTPLASLSHNSFIFLLRPPVMTQTPCLSALKKILQNKIFHIF
ncbi:unnamed protein product [Cuscuta europaea]|uniref:Uncharacterized protein n=1 Tax=Cuscuta europaea TaxID=41803 RepID=A0A9P0ZTC5_CUSEU|nr:unnamed protein product [Cuscuta europaea]